MTTCLANRCHTPADVLCGRCFTWLRLIEAGTHAVVAEAEIATKYTTTGEQR